MSMPVASRALAGLAFVALTGCYIEGGGCSGPICFVAGSEVCGLFCDDNSEFVTARCPDADDIKVAASAAVNRQRAQARQCANASFAAQASVQWDNRVFFAADSQALDMASNNFVSQTGSDGLGVSARLNRQGYPATATEQLIAAGAESTARVFDRWISDAASCTGIMNSNVRHFAMACRYDSDSEFGTYWTLVLASSD